MPEPVPASFWSAPATAGLVAGLVGASLNQALALWADRLKTRDARKARREELRFEKYHDRLLSCAEACYEALAGMVEDVGVLTAFFKSPAADLDPDRRAVMERFKAFSVAYQRLTVYVSKDVRDQLFAIRSKVVSIVNRHGLAWDPNLNAPELWRKIIDDFEELGRLRDAMAETIHRMLV